LVVFERFTDRARRVLVLSQDEARALNHNFIGTEHLLLGVIREEDGLAAKALTSLGISLDRVREKVKETIGPAAVGYEGSPPFTPRAKKVLELSLREALQLGHNYIGTEHILLGLVREGEGVGAQVLAGFTGGLARVRQSVLELLPGHAEAGEVSAHAQPLYPPTGSVFSTGPPSCSHRATDLEGALGYRRVEAAGDGDQPALPVIAVYCTRCGVTLAIHPDPGPTSV
jgi:ATP-dependent Clp protease ATP-binding subunit ClpC